MWFLLWLLNPHHYPYHARTHAPTHPRTRAQAPDLKERLLRAVTLLQAEVDLALLQQKIQGKVEEEVAKSQRKFFLHQQLKFIKQELGIETDEKEGLVEKFSERIADKTLPAAALKASPLCVLIRLLFERMGGWVDGWCLGGVRWMGVEPF